MPQGDLHDPLCLFNLRCCLQRLSRYLGLSLLGAEDGLSILIENVGEVLCATRILITRSCLPSNRIKSIAQRECVRHKSGWADIDVCPLVRCSQRRSGGKTKTGSVGESDLALQPCTTAILRFSKVTLYLYKATYLWNDWFKGASTFVL